MGSSTAPLDLTSVTLKRQTQCHPDFEALYLPQEPS